MNKDLLISMQRHLKDTMEVTVEAGNNYPPQNERDFHVCDSVIILQKVVHQLIQELLTESEQQSRAGSNHERLPPL